MPLRLFEWRIDGEIAGSQIACRLIKQQRDDLVGSLAKLIGRRVPVAQARQGVRDQRMLDDMEGQEAPPRTFISGGNVARPGSAMRPSARSFLARAMFEADQLPFGRRGVKRAA